MVTDEQISEACVRLAFLYALDEYEKRGPKAEVGETYRRLVACCRRNRRMPSRALAQKVATSVYRDDRRKRFKVFLRRNKLHGSGVGVFETEIQTAHHVPTPQVELSEERHDAVMELLKELPPVQVIILQQRYIHGQRQCVIARALGLSEGRISQLITLSALQLRQMIRQRFPELECAN